MNIILLFCALAPNFIKKFLYRNVFKYKIGKNVKIGISYLDCKEFIIDDGAYIGNFNKISNLKRVYLSNNSRVGSWNSISGPRRNRHNNNYCFYLGSSSSITRGHRFDCSDSIYIGDFTTIAGFGSGFFTHSIDIVLGVQSHKPVRVGSYCIVSSSCLLLMGSVLPDRSVLGAGSVLAKNFDEVEMLYVGVPAVPKKKFSPNSAYFSRKNGGVDWPGNG